MALALQLEFRQNSGARPVRQKQNQTNEPTLPWKKRRSQSSGLHAHGKFITNNSNQISNNNKKLLECKLQEECRRALQRSLTAAAAAAAALKGGLLLVVAVVVLHLVVGLLLHPTTTTPTLQYLLLLYIHIYKYISFGVCVCTIQFYAILLALYAKLNLICH